MNEVKNIFQKGAIAFLVIIILFAPVTFAKYSGGSGALDDPYQIATPVDLNILNTDSSDYDKSFVLTADINLSGLTFTTAVIAPNGYYQYFTGDFNGAGHKISNLTITSNGNNYLGLFGEINGGNIANIIVENVTITGDTYSSYLGGLAGYCYDSNILNCSSSGNIQGGDNSYYLGGLFGNINSSNINNCSTSGKISGGTASYYLAGIAGYCNSSNLNNCNSSSNIEVNSTSSTGGSYLGGLVGYCTTAGHINNCSATGSVTNTGDSSYYLGGLIGATFADLNNCFASGNITSIGNSQYIGGLVGQSFVSISNCHATGSISGSGGSSNYLGGLAGNITASINNCYATGSITWTGYSTVYLGGLAGQAMGDINNSYATGNVAGIGDNSQFFGGLAGHIQGTISNCNAAGAITAGVSASYIGGLAGSVLQDINHCFSTGSVSCGENSQWLGGLAGVADNNINNSYASGNVTAGDFAQQIGGLAGIAFGQITHCSYSGSISGGNSSIYIGGLIANAYTDCNIIYCYTTGSVTGGISSQVLGGLVGYNYGSISNCYSFDEVTVGSSAQTIGGLAGYTVGEINRCFSTGAVTCSYSSFSVGGLAGGAQGSVTDCYSTGNVTGGTPVVFLGGLVGYNSSSISSCYSTGILTAGAGSNYVGGLVGNNYDGSIHNGYFLDISGPDNGNGLPLTSSLMKKQVSFAGFDFVGETVNGANDVWIIYPGVTYPKLTWNFSVLAVKCTVATGTKPNADSISISGLTLATGNDFNDANASDSNFVEVSINSTDMNSPFVLRFPINSKTYKKGKYSFSGTENKLKKSFTYDSKSRKFAFTAKNAEFVGLGCPFTCQIKVGGYTGTGTLDETLVNGPKKTIPVNFMMGAKDTLRLDKITVKRSSTIGSLSASGGFAVKDTDVNMFENDLNISVDAQTFTIPAHSLIAGKGKFACTKAVVQIDDVNKGTAAATFDFNKSTFKLTIKNTSVSAGPGSIDFNVQFAGFNQVQTAVIR